MSLELFAKSRIQRILRKQREARQAQHTTNRDHAKLFTREIGRWAKSLDIRVKYIGRHNG